MKILFFFHFLQLTFQYASHSFTQLRLYAVNTVSKLTLACVYITCKYVSATKITILQFVDLIITIQYFTAFNPTTAQLASKNYFHFMMCLLHISASTWPQSGRIFLK